jgi:transaldolase
MKIFIDTADVAVLRELAATGLMDGVTTNPTIIARAGGNIAQTIVEISRIVETVGGTVSSEVLATDFETMVAEGRQLAAIGANVLVKIPPTPDGLRACRALSDEGKGVHVTTIFSAAQALLAAKAGARYVSPFVGRMNDVGQEGMELAADIIAIFANYPDLETEVMVSSLREVSRVVEAALMGADAVTIEPQTFRQMYDHALTDQALGRFAADAERTSQAILGKVS